jgi:hypothetical protein
VRKKFYVMLDEQAAERLVEQAQRNDRYPQQQAAHLIREGLQRAGALPAETHRADTPAVARA